jgi:hypothetical protein
MRLVALVLMAAFLVPEGVSAETLAAAAAREKARREKLAREKAGAGRVITQDDLSAPGAKEQQSAPSPTPAPSPLRESTPDGTIVERDLGRERLVESFRARHRTAEAAVDRAEAELTDAQRQLGALPNVSLAPPELYYARQVAEERVARAQQRLAEAEARRGEIEDEARRAGLYPGDLR